MTISPIALVLAMDWHVVVGRNIKRLRLASGASQESLAFDAGTTEGYLGKIERGQRNPTLKILLSICEALDASPVELFKSPRAK